MNDGNSFSITEWVIICYDANQKLAEKSYLKDGKIIYHVDGKILCANRKGYKIVGLYDVKVIDNEGSTRISLI